MSGRNFLAIQHSGVGARPELFAICIALLLALLPSAFAPETAVAAVPRDFSDTLLASVPSATDLAVLPDGRLIVASQQGGLTLISANGSTTRVANTPAPICADQDRGLLGITIDPSFASNRFIYLYYTFNKYGTCEDYSAKSPVDRLTRFTLTSTSPASLTSPLVLIDNIQSFQGIHDGGGLGFGKDGYLYLSVGDVGCDLDDPTKCSGSNGNARDMHRLTGKVLRITRDGLVPPANPYYAIGKDCRLTGRTDAGKICREIFATGLRNPFRLAFDPNASGTRFHINDVGSATWEEINLGAAGADYGWAICEGSHARGTASDCTGAPPGHVSPVFEYDHLDGCSAITGGAFVPNGVWPSAFNNTYLFADVTCGRIWRLNGSSVSEFASGLGPVTSIRFGRYGNVQALFYTSYANGGEVHRIAYHANGHPPVARGIASPNSGAGPLTVGFDAGTSSDLDGDPLTFAWDFGDGHTASGKTTSHRYTNDGAYSARLTVTDTSGLRDALTIPIAVGVPPTPLILSPLATDLFAVGQSIKLTGTATDQHGNALPDSSITWRVWRHHDIHEHPFFGPQSGNNLTFIAPVPEDLLAATNSYLRVEMTATDASGLSTTISQDLMPHKVSLTFTTDPAKLPLEIEEERFATPATLTSWAGWVIDVFAPPAVDRTGEPLEFRSWSDRGRSGHQITTPAVDTAYLATYAPTAGSSIAPVADARVKKSQPSSNQGASTGLTILSGTESDFETFLTFDVRGIAGPIKSAKIYLYAYDGTIAGPNVFSTSSAWSESTVTWANRPAPIGNRVTSLSPIPDQSWISIDVKSVITGNGTYSFVLVGRSFDSVSFYSRESSRNPPRLVINGNVSGDTAAPTVPTGFKITPTSSSSVRLNWKPATDNTAIGGYDIFRDGKLVTSVGPVTSFNDTLLVANTSYSYQVRARDTGGNRSAFSTSVSVITPAQTRIITVTPEADARVEEAKSSTNFGRSTELRASGGSGAKVQSFLRFTVNGVPGTVYRATLRLFVPAVQGAGSSDGPTLYLAGSKWSEQTITWKNRPARIGSNLGDLGAVSDGVWIEYNVTARVIGNGIYTFMLASGGSDPTRLYSREGSNKPQLVIAAFPDGNISSADIPEPIATATQVPTLSPTATSSPTPSATPTPVPTQTPALPIVDGFEQGLDDWDEVDGLTLQSDRVASGQSAAISTSRGTEQILDQAAFARRTIGDPRSDLYVRLRVRLESKDDHAVEILSFEDEQAEPLVTLLIDGNGRIAVRNDLTSEVIRVESLPPGTWNELQIHIQTGGDGMVELWLDGVLIARERMNFRAAPVAGVRLGDLHRDRSYLVLFDDLAIDVQCIATCNDPSPTPTPTESTVESPTPTVTADAEMVEPTPTEALPTATPEPTRTLVPEPTDTPMATSTVAPTPEAAVEATKESANPP